MFICHVLKIKDYCILEASSQICFWGTQHDTIMINLSLSYILMGMSGFNFNTVDFFYEAKDT
jgi:hypothetical protein